MAESFEHPIVQPITDVIPMTHDPVLENEGKHFTLTVTKYLCELHSVSFPKELQEELDNNHKCDSPYLTHTIKRAIAKMNEYRDKVISGEIATNHKKYFMLKSYTWPTIYMNKDFLEWMALQGYRLLTEDNQGALVFYSITIRSLTYHMERQQFTHETWPMLNKVCATALEDMRLKKYIPIQILSQ